MGAFERIPADERAFLMVGKNMADVAFSIRGEE